MATVGGSAIGNFYGGPVGGALGATVGGYIDATFLFPRLFGEALSSSASVSGVDVTLADENVPISHVYGTARVAARIIRVEPPSEVTRGGNAKRGEPATKSFFQTFVALATANEIDRFARIWMDGQLVYSETDRYPASGPYTGIAGDSSLGGPGDIWFDFDSRFTEQNFWHLVIETKRDVTGFAVSTAPDLSIFEPNFDLLLKVNGGGTTTPGATQNEFLLSVVSRTSLSHGGSRLVLDLGRIYGPILGGSRHINFLFLTAGVTFEIEQTGIPNWRVDVFPQATQATQAETFTGGQLSGPVRVIERLDGDPDLSPFYRGFSGFAGENMTLSSFGSRLPTSIDFLAVQKEDLTLQELFQLLMVRSGRSASEVVVTGSAASVIVPGFITDGVIELDRSVQPLMVAYDLAAQENGGRIRIFFRKEATEIDVDPGHLDARDASAISGALIKVTRSNPETLPSRIIVTFADIRKDYQESTITAVSDDPVRTSVEPVDLSVCAMDRAQALEIGARLMAESEYAIAPVSLSLPRRYEQLEESDVLVIPNVLGKDWRIWIQRADIGTSGRIEIDGFVYHKHMAGLGGDFAPSGGAGTGSESQGRGFPYVPQPASLTVIDIGMPLFGSEDYRNGYYVAAVSEGPQWTGVSIWRSTDDGTSYHVLGVHSAQAVIGWAEGFLPDTQSPTDVLTIRLENGTLESWTSDDLDRQGYNRALYGDEILRFRTATKVAPLTWELTDWHERGISGTVSTGHAGGERFVMLDAGGIQFYPHMDSVYDRAHLLRAVPEPGGDIDQSSDIQVVVGEKRVLLNSSHTHRPRLGWYTESFFDVGPEWQSGGVGDPSTVQVVEQDAVLLSAGFDVASLAGVVQLDVGAASGSSVAMQQTLRSVTATAGIMGSFRVYADPGLSNARFRIGWAAQDMRSTTGDPTDGFWLELDQTLASDWQLCSARGGAVTKVATGRDLDGWHWQNLLVSSEDIGEYSVEDESSLARFGEGGPDRVVDAMIDAADMPTGVPMRPFVQSTAISTLTASQYLWVDHYCFSPKHLNGG